MTKDDIIYVKNHIYNYQFYSAIHCSSVQCYHTAQYVVFVQYCSRMQVAAHVQCCVKLCNMMFILMELACRYNICKRSLNVDCGVMTFRCSNTEPQKNVPQGRIKYIGFYQIVSYHIILYCILSYHIVLYCTVSFHIILCCIVLYGIISFHIVSFHIILYCIVLYRIVLFHFI